MEGTLSGKERDRLKVIEAVREKRLKQTEAALHLVLSAKHPKAANSFIYFVAHKCCDAK